MSASPAVTDAVASPVWAFIAAERAKVAPGTLLGFEMGDFVEFFDRDAHTVADTLGIVLAQRADVPMCGILRIKARLDHYRQRLEAAGHTVTIVPSRDPYPDDESAGRFVDPENFSPKERAQLAAMLQRLALIEDIDAVSRRILTPVLGAELVKDVRVLRGPFDQEATARALSLLAAQVATADPLDQDLRADLHNEAWPASH